MTGHGYYIPTEKGSKPGKVEGCKECAEMVKKTGKEMACDGHFWAWLLSVCGRVSGCLQK